MLPINQQSKPYWMLTFERELGIQETEGAGNTARILEYFASLDDGYTWSDADAWCSALMNFVMMQSLIMGTKSPAAGSWETWGRKLEMPMRGAVTTLWRTTPQSWERHVGLLDDMNFSQVRLGGGNQDNKACYKWYPINRVVCYRWPILPILNTPERRAYFRGADLGIIPAKPEAPLIPKEFKWYELVFWKELPSKIIMAIISFLRVYPKTAGIGDLLEEFFRKKDTNVLTRLIEKIIELINTIIKKLKGKES